MQEILSALVNFAEETGRFTVAKATAVYDRLWQIIAMALLACALAFMLNAGFGWETPSLVLAIVFAIATAFVWAKPLNILLIVGGTRLVAMVATDAKSVNKLSDAMKGYLGVLKWTLVAVVTFLFITGTVSFRGNPKAILPILTGLGIIGLFQWVWPGLFTGTWGRRIMYGYAVLIVTLSFGSLTPVPALVKQSVNGWFGEHHTQSRAPAAEIPLASSPQASWARLSVPAGGRSALVTPIAGKYPAVTGVGAFLLHNVFADGTECAYGEAGCVSGGRLLKGYYVSNESGAMIHVTVEFK